MELYNPAKVIEEFIEIVTKAFNQIISEKVNERLNSDLNKEQEKQQAEEEIEESISKIITTEEELDGLQIVVAIHRRKVAKDRIVFRDTQSYFGVLLDDNNRKPICRLHLDGGTKYISLFNHEKIENQEKINTIDEIFKLEKQLLETIGIYEHELSPKTRPIEI